MKEGKDATHSFLFLSRYITGASKTVYYRSISSLAYRGQTCSV